MKKNYFIIFVLFSTWSYLYGQADQEFTFELEKDDALKIRKISERYLKINQVLDNNATAAFDAVSSIMDMQKIDKASKDNVKLGFSFMKVIAKGSEMLLEQVKTKVPVIGTAVTFASDMYNIQAEYNKQQKQIIQATQSNHVKEILAGMAAQRTALFPTDKNFQLHVVEEAMVKRFEKEGSNFLSKLDDAVYHYEMALGNTVTGFDGKVYKLQTLYFMKALLEELITNMDEADYSKEGVLQCYIETKGCEYKYWVDNKDNCVYIKEAKYRYVGALSQQLTKLTSSLRTMSGGTIPLTSLNVPIVYKVTLAKNHGSPGYYIIPAHMINSNYASSGVYPVANGDTNFGIIIISEDSNRISQNKKLFPTLINRVIKAKQVSIDQPFFEDVQIKS